MMREVFGEILRKKYYDFFGNYCPSFDILDIANVISRKVLPVVLEARNFYQLIGYKS